MEPRYLLGKRVEIKANRQKPTVTVIEPDFCVYNTPELMIRNQDFYAVWLEDIGLWSTNEDDLITLVDNATAEYAAAYKEREARPEEKVIARYMRYSSSGLIKKWHSYCSQDCRDFFRPLNEKIIFANDKPNKKDYASWRLPYALQEGPCPAYDRIMSVLYSEEERRKLEWAIGSIVCGDSKEIQKFIVLYGSAGTGKSTFLNIVRDLFKLDEDHTYCCTFDSKALGSSGHQFSLEPFRTNPLVAIQDDGDLSKIEDNTRLNSLVSHEQMVMNTKNKSTYEFRSKAFLFLGTNRPVKITDAKSGLLRRLIDVSPTGNKIKRSEYDQLKEQVKFELGAIAWHCLKVYEKDPHRYDNYIPISMMRASNDFYNFVADNYFRFKQENGTTLTAAYAQYNDYCIKANVPSFAKKSRMTFAEELKNYFEDFSERLTVDGTRIRSYYRGFRTDIFEPPSQEEQESEAEPEDNSGFIFEKIPSILDEIGKDWPAQYASKEGTPLKKWVNVKTTLGELDTSKLHYVKVPENHIVIDFDIPDENGEKSLERNLEEASKWPPTYAELSKSGKGIHLHYIYDGDASKLSKLYAPYIEIKVFSGDSSLRRLLTLCTAIGIAHISSGLPLREEKSPMLNNASIKSERSLRKQIERNLRKEIHPNTKPSIDMIKKLLDDAYESGLKYDVSDMRNAIFGFAASSTNQSDNCIRLVTKMHFKSEEPAEPLPDNHKRPLAFFDCEVFPNLLVICWKLPGEENSVNVMINPKPEEVEDFIDIYDLVGFNNRKYDNHIIYARSIGLSLEAIYQLSQNMIVHKTGFLPQAYDISYTDIYDYSSKKQSLKKWEIELGTDHVELGMRWDQPVPEKLWDEVARYCCYDVLATEKVWKATKADFAGRMILAKLTNSTVNDTTNTLSARFIFRGDKNPQSQFNYRFMGDMPEKVYRSIAKGSVIFNNFGDEYTLFDEEGRPVFKGYTYDAKERISRYRGEEVGEGGYVYSEPGIYTNVALLDIESMHPHSAIAEKLFGEYYTDRFKQIVDARLSVKHKDFEKAKELLNGELAPYLDDPEMVDGLKQALKIVINSVYGLTSAKFMNPFKDSRNIDNIVAKRGALFMINLKHVVQEKGFKVAHIKTDSIKIPNATPEIIKFVQDYGEQYGYHFLHEATYERMCLVNDAVYIAKYDTAEAAKKKYGYVPVDLEKHGGEWTATGTQFQIPYVFKMLFTKEPLVFDDVCETKSVTTSMYLDLNENLPEDEHDYHFVGKVGRFCPVKKGMGGGLLMRQTENKKTGETGYSAVVGTKGWRWKESGAVENGGGFNEVDLTYYDRLVNEAMDAIAKYGDPEWFRSGEPKELVFDPYPLIDPDECPFDI